MFCVKAALLATSVFYLLVFRTVRHAYTRITQVAARKQHPVQATPGVGVVNFWSFTVA